MTATELLATANFLLLGFSATVIGWLLVRYPSPDDLPDQRPREPGVKYLGRLAGDYLDFWVGGLARTIIWLVTPKDSDN